MHIQSEHREMKCYIKRCFDFEGAEINSDEVLGKQTSSIISGEAGLGKSVFANQYLYRWAIDDSDGLVTFKINCREMNKRINRNPKIAPLYLSDFGKFLKK